MHQMCDIEGDMVNKVLCFVDTKNLHKRSDHSFRNKIQSEHHIGTSILLKTNNKLLAKSLAGWCSLIKIFCYDNHN